MVGALIAAMLAASSLSVTAQEEGQYASMAGQTIICAPWSKTWDISKGQWYFRWYKWCVDPSLYDPAVESSWYIEWGNWEWGEQVNLCPESGNCRVTTTG